MSAGDLIGATPLLSALFHDEPSVEAFNIMGLDYNGVGNHEFDEGVDELLRVAYGDRRSATTSRPARTAATRSTAAATATRTTAPTSTSSPRTSTYKDSGETIFPPYAIHNFPGGVKVAFVGMTLEGTPEIVSPDGIASVDFNDEADSVNALVPFLKQRGVKAIVVLLHEGGSVQGGAGGSLALINSCNAPARRTRRTARPAPIVDVVNRMDDEIDIVVTGHTNWAVNCLIDGKVVTGAASQGRLITDIDAKIDRNTNDFVRADLGQQPDRHPGRRRRRRPSPSLIAEYNVVRRAGRRGRRRQHRAPLTPRRTINAHDQSTPARPAHRRRPARPPVASRARRSRS